MRRDAVLLRRLDFAERLAFDIFTAAALEPPVLADFAGGADLFRSLVRRDHRFFGGGAVRHPLFGGTGSAMISLRTNGSFKQAAKATRRCPSEVL